MDIVVTKLIAAVMGKGRDDKCEVVGQDSFCIADRLSLERYHSCGKYCWVQVQTLNIYPCPTELSLKWFLTCMSSGGSKNGRLWISGDILCQRHQHHLHCAQRCGLWHDSLADAVLQPQPDPAHDRAGWVSRFSGHSQHRECHQFALCVCVCVTVCVCVCVCVVCTIWMD